ncbi:peptidoglycan DD-metalloendopeptidase family protein [Asticcacaulis sp.]|uniref:peptidoglycan DD-metalloendopeptidase family protein n=1 Tax=Asticcacaulis sp. TaxID=1872648 RepID=UPI002CC5212E|nr:peptidoglycan DD-metalloendopeptidase family protein [Asticcacaulis sp.]HTM83178.1 peptidoglycan DD-metalloendopeptidase family protein [Asticcacaulis sp.]
MILQILNSDGCVRHPVIKLSLAGLSCAAVLALQACTGAGMPQPKYPIYMQDKPAESSATIQPAPVEEVPPATTTPSPSGSVQVTELAPMTPPPPPPPPAEMMKPVETAAAPAGAGYVYVLQSKDTLFGVSRRFSVPVKNLYALNGLTVASSLRVGQKILLPVSAVDKGVEDHANGPTMTKVKAVLAAAATTPKPAAPITTTTTVTTTTKPTVAPPSVAAAATKPATITKPVVAKPVPPVAGFPANAQIAQMGKGKFVWPVKGHVLVPFGQLAPNIRNDGINIGASSGTEVKAASEGTVVYEGDQVKELGNTIYIKHDNGWYTGYSHLQSMKVKNNEHVSKGQVIGTVGQTGTIDKPQLHFEIRYTPSTDIARPIDPTLVLP